MEDQTNNRIREEFHLHSVRMAQKVENNEMDYSEVESSISDWWLLKIDELLKSQREEIAKQFIEIEKDKLKDAEHCTCLGYAIIKIFGKKYEKILQKKLDFIIYKLVVVLLI